MRSTKIVCTIGPATRTPEKLGQLIDAGMNVARLNFSHGTQAEHAEVVSSLREIADRRSYPLAILQDLAGPKIRTGPVAAGSIQLVSGKELVLTSREVPGDEKEISVTYKELPHDVQVGDTLLLNDGALELTVEEVRGEDIVCRIVVGGPLSSSKGINLPSRSIQAPILDEKDHRDLLFGLAQGVDYVALSFVRTDDDVRLVRQAITDAGHEVPLIAKIELREAIDKIDAIMPLVDGIMVARGDLGVEIPLEQVPGYQKYIIEKANCAGKPVITATQMLKSMVDSPHPTRAEVSDVANAILDGSDAVMLSEETTIGHYAIEAVQTMSRIAESAEEILPHDSWRSRLGKQTSMTDEAAVALAAVRMAARIDAAAICTLTQSGSTARQVSRNRPQHSVLAMTPDPATYRRLALVWGVIPFLTQHSYQSEQLEQVEEQAVEMFQANGYVQSGQSMILTAGLPLYIPGTTNMIKIAHIE